MEKIAILRQDKVLIFVKVLLGIVLLIAIILPQTRSYIPCIDWATSNFSIDKFIYADSFDHFLVNGLWIIISLLIFAVYITAFIYICAIGTSFYDYGDEDNALFITVCYCWFGLLLIYITIALIAKGFEKYPVLSALVALYLIKEIINLKSKIKNYEKD